MIPDENSPEFKAFEKKCDEVREEQRKDPVNQVHVLTNIGLFTLGWIMAKHGIDAEPVLPLAQALKWAGVESSHVDEILEKGKTCDSTLN